MNTRNVTNEERIPADRLAEAGVWVARLHGDDRSAAVESGFRQWLDAHPLNARAFELTTEVWEDSQNLRRVVPFAHEAAKPRRRRFRLPSAALVAMAAAVAIVAISAILYFRHGIATGVGEQRLLTLEDGTRVFLNTATRVVVRYDKDTRRVELAYGEALFDVAKRPDWPFVVQVADREITALGTSFVVRHENHRTAVTLVEGKVAVAPARSDGAGHADSAVGTDGSARESNARRASLDAPNAGHIGKAPETAAGSGEVFTLAPGQRLTIVDNGSARIDTPSLDTAIAWRRGQVILDDTPLASAVAELNRYSTVKLAVERPETAGLLINGLFQAGDSMSFANAVAETYGLSVVERRNQIILSGLPKPPRK